MTVEETKHDLFLKRIQITVAILAGLATLVVGVYNAKKLIFPEKEEAADIAPSMHGSRPPAATSDTPPPGRKIQSALEDVGVSWIQKLKEEEKN